MSSMQPKFAYKLSTHLSFHRLSGQLGLQLCTCNYILQVLLFLLSKPRQSKKKQGKQRTRMGEAATVNPQKKLSNGCQLDPRQKPVQCGDQGLVLNHKDHRDRMLEEIETRLKVLEEEAKTLVEEYTETKVLMEEELLHRYYCLSKNSISGKPLLQLTLPHRFSQDEGTGLLQLLQRDSKPTNIMTRDGRTRYVGTDAAGFTA